MTFDDIRARFPTLGFGLYALTPSGPVTLEIYAGEDVFQFGGETESAAIAAAFPDLASEFSKAFAEASVPLMAAHVEKLLHAEKPAVDESIFD